jgi:polyhydroxybutyrate depolymerase
MDAGKDAGVDASVAGETLTNGSPDGGVTGDASILVTRPYTLHVPTGYKAGSPTPLVVMFHGYGASGAIQELYFDITATSDANTFLYAYGNGTVDQTGSRFWNADDACCDLYNVPVDDVAYFDAIVADVKSKYDVDPKRLFVIGHSNGGFMSHRLACDRSSSVAAIVSLAGAVWDDPTKCAPTDRISVAEVHGNADKTISYTGGSTGEGTYPSAPTTVATWAAKNGCTGALTDTGKTLDLDSNLAGNETQISAYGSCPSGIDVQLWTIQGGAHVPTLTHPGWGDAVWGFLSTHAKP